MGAGSGTGGRARIIRERVRARLGIVRESGRVGVGHGEQKYHMQSHSSKVLGVQRVPRNGLILMYMYLQDSSSTL